jgi:hypothetical protein
MEENYEKFITRNWYDNFYRNRFMGLFLDFQIIAYEWGLSGSVIAFFILPGTFIIAPFYAGIKYGYWMPLLVSYGGGLMALLFNAVGTENKDNT